MFSICNFLCFSLLCSAYAIFFVFLCYVQHMQLPLFFFVMFSICNFLCFGKTAVVSVHPQQLCLFVCAISVHFLLFPKALVIITSSHCLRVIVAIQREFPPPNGAWDGNTEKFRRRIRISWRPVGHSSHEEFDRKSRYDWSKK